MACTMAKATRNGQETWWQASCRSEDDWYAITWEDTILVDHLPTKEAAESAAREALKG